MLTRRETFALTVGASLIPSYARTQSALQLPRLGFVSLAGTNYPAYEFFTKELTALGYADAQNIRIEARFADRVVGRLPGLIAELIALPLDAIAIVGAATAKQVSAATKTIPLVFSIVVDPVADSLVADARRPGRQYDRSHQFRSATGIGSHEVVEGDLSGTLQRCHSW